MTEQTTETLIKKNKISYYEDMSHEKKEDINYIVPAFKHKFGICISTSDFYTKYASLLLLSLIENSNPKNQYDIIILTTDMCLENQHILKTLTNKPNISIRIYNINEKIKNYKFYTWSHFTPNTYYRLSIPELLQNFDKILYLDSDTIVNMDVAEIFKIDFEENYLAAAKDTHVLSFCNGLNLEQLEYNRNTLKLQNPKNYFQMGVIMFNLKKFNKSYKNKSLLDIASRVEYRWLDQDILNVEFQGKIKELPIKYNVMIANKPPYIDEYYLPEEYKEQYYQARLSPGIIHYCGGVYYRYPFVPDMERFFWKYALKSPFFEEILTQMIALKLPQNDLQNKEIDCLRDEFQKTHFPNINTSFATQKKQTQLLFVIQHPLTFRLKKLGYKLKIAFTFGSKHEKYSRKYNAVKQLLKDAKKFKKQMLKV